MLIAAQMPLLPGMNLITGGMLQVEEVRYSFTSKCQKDMALSMWMQMI